MAQPHDLPAFPSPAAAAGYWIDAWQRSVLFLDVMRRRAAQYEAHAAEVAPNVLDYAAELVLDGRTLAKPVNYLLARIVPPEGVAIDPKKRPFVIVDPRAGHGPGIGGFKADSEIGVAMKAGHPAYFIGFLPEPMPGQTILDVAAAEAVFLEAVIARHPEAEGKPCVIGNCQAGWAVMILAALRPELFGPIIIAGTPLSYWAGVRGQNPMRYSGGLMGGSWMTALAGDLGAGIFDGAALVQNFEAQNPANTLWTKQYNLWSKIDTEPERYLDFEKWWGGHITLNAEEMQWIVDELFVGNHLAAGDIRTPDGTAVDLRSIRSPIVVFCSKGDNITPPQQALDWILDLYDSVDDIRAWGQTIVYTVHEHVGHLGIFVSAGVAKKEHDEFASNIDLIDVLPPGLYEAVLTPKGEAVDHPDLVTGEWVMRCEARTLDDIRALGGNDLADERKFAAAARLSEINLALYRTFAQPAVRAMVSPAARRGDAPDAPAPPLLRDFRPAQPVARLGRRRRRARPRRPPPERGRQPAPRRAGRAVAADRRRLRGLSPRRRAAVRGQPSTPSTAPRRCRPPSASTPRSTQPPRKAPRSELHKALVERRTGQLEAAMTEGGLPEALVRALLWVGMARHAVDERGFAAITRLRDAHEANRRMTLAEFKALVRDQYQMLLIDEEAALARHPGAPARRRSRSAARPSPSSAASSRRAAPPATPPRPGSSASPPSSASAPSW